MNNIFEQPFIWNNKQHFIETLPHNSQILFAYFCANQVIHLVPQEHQKVCKKAIEVALLFVEGKATKEECQKASTAASAAAAYTGTLAAAYAAAAADAAYAYAAAAADAAASAAYAAAYASSLSKEEIKQGQMNYLRELIINNLTEEEKDCWLLVASF